MRGIPLSWELAVASIYVEGGPTKSEVVWSPCSKFVAVRTRRSVEVLDAATLNRLATFEYHSPYGLSYLGFSPDSCSLTLVQIDEVISWDLQTGRRLSEIRGGFPSPGFTRSFTHSKDGKVVAAAYRDGAHTECKFYTFDLPCRTHLGPLIVPDGKLVTPIWTHDKYLRFATVHPGSITIWEVEFTLKHPPTQVESFPIPKEVIDGDDFLFLPALYRLAFTLNKTIQVRDVKASKLLFESEVKQRSAAYSFSSDGHFFAFATATNEIHVWKESPVGYVPHQQSTTLLDDFKWLHLSPNGGSIVFPLGGTINLWHARDHIHPPPTPPTEKRGREDFILTFPLNQKSAAFAQRGGNVVTILDLKSGNSRLTIDTGMEVERLGMVGGIVIVVDKEQIVTWNLPGGDRALNAGINDSVLRITLLDRSLEDIVFTGRRRARVTRGSFGSPWFTEDERELLVFDGSKYGGWQIINVDGSGDMELMPLENLWRSGMPTWQSRHGYEVTGDGWVLGPTRKRLLWLPHRWREEKWRYRLWSGRFLGLSHRLSEVVILEFLE